MVHRAKLRGSPLCPPVADRLTVEAPTMLTGRGGETAPYPGVETNVSPSTFRRRLTKPNRKWKERTGAPQVGLGTLHHLV